MKGTIHRKGAGAIALLLTFLMTLFLSGCGNPAVGAAEDLAGEAVITDYYTYGTFFQAKGTADLSAMDDGLSAKDISRADLLLRSGNGESDTSLLELSYSISKTKLSFRTSKQLDRGLCLDTLETGSTAAFLQLTWKDGATRLLSLTDGTGQDSGSSEDPIEYYTLPYKHGRRKVTTEFQTVRDTETLVFHAKRSRLPSDVYDIVVDPGHGGKDPGAWAGGYEEKDIVLDIGKRLTTELERAGYKVLLTRDGTEDPNVNMAYTEYDADGRVNRTCGSRAKLCLSLHLNYNNNTNQNGVQIYKARLASNDFASSLAEELVSATDLAYSTMGGQTAKGVYVRTFTSGDIREAQAKARQKGYKFYNVSTSTDYFFMIREYGCRATGAYVDGRNPEYGTNEYRTYNQGVESCLCELGFLSNEHDRTVLRNDQRNITRALTEAVDTYIASLYEEPDNGTSSADLLAKEQL